MRGGQAPKGQNTAVLLETRKHPALSFVLRNALDNLPAVSWNILLFYGTDNEAWLKELVATSFSAEKDKGRIRLEPLNVSNLPMKSYSDLLKKKDIYERIPTETFLLFQTDSMICAPHKDLLGKFMQYDYVGAPWTVGGVGNGGLSLRKKSKILQVIEACGPDTHNNEDGYFNTDCAKKILSKPTDKEAQEFSVEAVYSPQSFGIHKAWYHLPLKMKELEAQCPGIGQLQRLQQA